MQRVRLKDKTFKTYIPSATIQEAVNRVAQAINQDLAAELPLFLVVLNGSFMYAADLLKEVNFPCEISFVKLASYHGTSSSGTVNELIGLTDELKGRTVVVIEDIVDTGTTLEKIAEILRHKEVKQMKVATCLLKPDAYKKSIPVDYVGIAIANDFVIGYGLDYDGLGRNLKDLYVLDEDA